MQAKHILNKIGSNYILKNIFNYLEENVKFKLVNYSKFFQKKLDIKLKDYAEK